MISDNPSSQPENPADPLSRISNIRDCLAEIGLDFERCDSQKHAIDEVHEWTIALDAANGGADIERLPEAGEILAAWTHGDNEAVGNPPKRMKL